MRPRTNTHPSRLRRFVTTLTAATALAHGCAHDRPPPVTSGAEPAAPFGPAYQALVRRAQGPGDAPRSDVPLPAGLPPELARTIEPSNPGFALASRGFAETIDELASLPPIEPAGTPAATPRDQDSALRRYLAGREKLLRGDAGGASLDLRTATRLDPAAPEPWRELGEAQLLLGIRAEAVSAFTAAVERGLGEARTFEFLGRASLDRNDAASAARYFAHAWKANPVGTDPALPAVILVGLGRSLLQQDRLAAGRDALVQMLVALDRIPGPTRYAQELGFMVRRRGELWRDVGDSECRLGRFDAALEAYAHAADHPAVEDLALPARYVYASLRAAKPAAGAVFLLDRIADADGFVRPRDVELLRAVAADPATRRDAAAALAAYRAALPKDTPGGPGIAGGLARAQAAMLATRQARTVLIDHLRHHPDDAPTTITLLAISDDPVADAAELLLAAPLNADPIARSLYRAHPDARALLQAFAAARPNPAADAARILLVYLDAGLGQREQAAQRAAALAPAGPIEDAAVLARVHTAASLGRWADAEAALARLRPETSPDARRARVRALHAMQRDSEALTILRPLLPQGRTDDLLLAAELSLTPRCKAATPRDTEKWLHDVLTREPRRDEAYEMLLALYSPEGPSPDQDRAGQVVRDLREKTEGGRLLALLRAQEFMRRSFESQAESELLDLVREDPTDPEALELLASIWEHPAPPARPRSIDPVAWLRERHSERPADPVITATLARVLIGNDRGDEAEALLRQRLAAGDDPNLSRNLERLLRGTLGKADEADRLAASRLEPEPRSIDAALELADLRARQDRPDDAAAAICSGLPRWAELTSEQRRRLLAVAGAVAIKATEKPELSAVSAAPGRNAAVKLFDELVARDIDFSRELHQRRLVLLASDQRADEGRLTAAADLARAKYPDLGPAPMLILGDALIEAGRERQAMSIIARACEQPDAPLDAFIGWFRVVARAGEADDVRRLVTRAEQAGQIKPIADRLTADTPADPTARRDPRGVVAYYAALLAAQFGRQTQSEAVYELALTYDPYHPWANNNLGYALADEGRNLDRAEKLLERAYAALPDEGSILDSLGWLRYRQGILRDLPDPATGAVRLGALTLLERARQSASGASSPVVLDHCGDAQWAAGMTDDARRTWAAAQRASVIRLRSLGSQQAPDSARQEVLALQARLRDKLDAARNGKPIPYTPPGTPATTPAEPPSHPTGGP
jgi:tetratricopeptide (TPR) repeat protein